MGHAARAIRRSARTSRTKTLFGISNMSSAGGAGTNSYATATGGGESGTVYGGWGAAALFRLDALTATTRTLLRNLDTGSGYWLMIENANAGHMYAKTGVGTAQVFSPIRLFTASDVGRIFLLICRHNGFGLLETLCDRTSYGGTAMASYLPGSLATQLAGDGVTVFDEVTFRGMPTQVQLNGLFDAVRLKGSIPVDAGPVYQGVRNFSVANFLQAGAGLGIVGSASALTVQALVQNHAGISGYVAATFSQPSGNVGYQLQVAGTTITFTIATAAGTTAPASATLSADQANALVVATATWDGTNTRLYADGVLLVTTPSTGFAPGANGMRIGDRIGPTSAPFGGAVLMVQGGNFVASLADIQASGATGQQGYLSVLPGAQHLYDLRQDVAGGSVPTQVLDRIGTDHLTKNGIDVRSTANSIRGVGPYGAADGWITAVNGGIQGANTGFHVVVDMWLTKVPTATETMVGCSISGGTTGWSVTAQSASLRAIVYGVVAGNAYTLTAGDLNKRTRIIVNKTATVLQTFVNGVQVGADQAAATYVANVSQAMQVGQLYGTQVFSSGYIEVVQGGNTLLTPAEITALNADLTVAPPITPTKTLKRWVLEQDIAYNGGALPDVLAERITGGDSLTRFGSPLFVANIGMLFTHRWSVREELLRRPTSLNVKTYGARGFSSVSMLSSAPGAGVVGSAAGFWGALHFRLDSLPGAGSQMLASNLNTAATAGWGLQSAANLLRLLIGNGTTVIISSTYTLTAADVGVPLIAFFQVTTTAVRLFVHRLQQGSDMTVAYVPASGVSTQLGCWTTQAFTAGTIFGFAGGVGTPSLAQVRQVYDSTVAAGRLATIAGMTEHFYDLTQDVGAGAAVPATVLDRIGTDHLTRQGMDVKTGPNGLRGVGPYSTADGWQTAIGGGILGSNGGFHALFDLVFYKVPTVAGTIVSGTNYYLQETASGTINFVVASPFTGTSVYTVTAPDIGQRKRVVIQYTGTVMQFWINGVQIGPDIALASFTPSTGVPFKVGANVGVNAFTSGTIECLQGGNFVLTSGEIATANADLTQPPPVIAGKTSKRWRFEQDIAAAGGALPMVSVERVSGGDSLVRIGGPLELAVEVDPASRPVLGPAIGTKLSGVTKATASNYLGTAAALAGSNTGFSVSVVATLYPGQFLVGRTNNATQGWVLYVTSGGALLFSVHNGTSFVSPAAVYTVSAIDAARPQVITAVHTGFALRLYLGRQQLGADLTIGSFAAYAGPTTFLATPVGGFTANQTAIFAADWADSPYTLAEVVALSDAFDATGMLGTVAGKSTHHYDINAAIVANAGAVPATIPDTIGSDNLTRTGTLDLYSVLVAAPPAPAQLTDTLAPTRANAMVRNGSAVLVRGTDTTIDGRRMLGAQGFSTTNVMQCTGGLVGSASGDWISWLGTINTAPSAFACLVGKRNTVPQAGYDLTVNASNIYYEHAYNAGIVAVSTPLTTAMLGVLKVFTGVFTGSVIRLYVDGVQLGGDIACTPGYLASSLPFRVGSYGDATFAANTVSWYGDAGGLGVPTLAQIQEHAAMTLATGRMQAIAGLTTMLHDPVTDTLASGVDTVPAQVLDRVGSEHLTRVGIDVRSTANGIRGVGPYGTADGWQTALGGGIQGASGGFFVTVDVWLTQVPTGVETIAWCAVTGTSGWYLQTIAGGILRWVMPSGQLSSAYTITAGDLNKRTRFTVHRTGLNMQLFVNGAQVGADTGGTFTANAANVASFQLGIANGAAPFVSGYTESCSGGLSALTAGELTTLHADLTQAAPVIAGKTTRRWVLESDIAAASGALPAKSVERVSGGDDLVRLGSPLTLAQRTERPWGWDVAPITRLASGFSASARYESANGQGVVGANAGFFVGLVYRVISTATGRAAAYNDGNWAFVVIGGTSINFSVRQASDLATRSSPTLSIAADGKLRTVCGVYDGTNVRAFAAKGVTGVTTVAGYSIPSASVAMILGSLAGGSSPATGIEILGLVGGHAVPSAAEIAAWEDACMAYEGIKLLAGIKTEHMYSANVKSGTTLLDMVGNHNLVAVATPTETALYARAWAS